MSKLKDRYQALPEKRKKGLRRFGESVLDLLVVMAYSWVVGRCAGAFFGVEWAYVSLLFVIAFYLFPAHIHYDAYKRIEEKSKKENQK